MKVFEDQIFQDFWKKNSRRVYQDLEFRRCRFVDCTLIVGQLWWRRPTIRNVRLIDCAEQGAYLWGAILEDVLVDGLKTTESFQIWGTLFKHVTLRGKIGPLMISNILSPRQRPSRQEVFLKENAEYYSSVDWALDISEAEFGDCCMRGVPARLIRRDPKTQVVVTREKALEGRWRQLELSDTWWPISLEFLIDEGDSDVVLVAPKRNRSYAQLLDGLNKLRDAGVAEPD